MNKWLLLVMSVVVLSAPFNAAWTGSAVYAEDQVTEGNEGKDKEKKEKKEKKPKAPKVKKASGVAAEIVMFSQKFASDDQKPKLEELVKKYDADKAEYKTTYDARLKDIKKQIKELDKEADKEKITALKNEDKEIKARNKAIDTNTRNELLAMMSEDQKASFNGALTSQKIIGKLKKAKLTDDQKTKVEEIALSVAKSDKEADPKKAYQSVWDKVAADVLTEDQRALVIKPKKEKQKPEKVENQKNA